MKKMNVAKLRIKNTHLFVVIILFIDLIAGRPPQLNVPEESIFTISENTTKMDITCSGDKRLQWKIEVHQFANYDMEFIDGSLDDDFTSRFLNPITVTSGQNGSQHFSTAHVNKPNKYHTGYYHCFYFGEEDGPTASAFIYAHSDKGSGFLLDENVKPRVILESKNGSVHLDCRTTRPDIEVTVFIGEEEVPQNKYKFDPRVGIIFEDVTFIPDYNHELICTNNYRNDYGKIPFLTFIWLRKPSIKNHRNTYFVVGEEFALNCSIPLKENYKPEFFWNLPNRHAHAEIKVFGEETFWVSNLKIKNGSLSDSGTYYCKVSLDDKSTENSKKIEIIEHMVPFVKLLAMNNTKGRNHFVNEGNSFEWVTWFEGYPRNLSYTFYDHQRNTLPHMDDERISTNYVYEEGILSLGIKGVTAEDQGNYSVRLEAPNGSFGENYAILNVNATPKIEFGEIASLLPANENISVTAFITTNDIQPDVNWWFYSDCPNGIGSCDITNGIMVPHNLENDTLRPNHYKSIASLRPSTSGELLCQLKNVLSVNDTRLYLNVSDKSASFLVTVRTETDFINLTRQELSKTINATEGDNIVIKCFGLDFLFNNVTFSYSESKYYEEACDTELSTGRCLTIKNIDLREDWLIECIAQTRVTNKVEKISFWIDVVEMMAPSVLPNSTVSAEGTSLSVKSPYPFVLACYVEGRPKPKIMWLKDGANIFKFLENKDYVFLSDDEQTLEFTFSTQEDKGKYECIAENRAGRIQPFTQVLIDGQAFTFFAIIFVGLFIISFSVVIFLIAKFNNWNSVRKDLRMAELCLLHGKNVHKMNKECTIGEQIELLPYNSSYEVERENINLGKQLGAGAFGRVLLAEVKNLEGRPSTRVAVKMCKYGGDKAIFCAFILELKIMIHLGKHLNIVNLIGAHTSNIVKGDLWILMEYCKYGSLLKFIQRAKEQFMNQIDPVTGDIDVNKTFIFRENSLSQSSRRSSGGSLERPDLNHDGCLETHSGDSKKIGSSSERRSLTGSICGSKERILSSSLSALPSGNENYELTTELPMANFKPSEESSVSNSANESHYCAMPDRDMISADSPTSPSTSGNIPGVSAPFTTTDIICWAWQVANGMEYLTRRNVLHGDLAARNLLLADDNVVKICDFGLSRDMFQKDVYVEKNNDIMPFKWMAPEAITQKAFSIQSDVWAYGITLWEMFTLGDTPYPGIPVNEEFAIALQKGMRMEKPKYCNDEIYTLLINCWGMNPIERPSFRRILDFWSDMLSPERKQHYVNMNVDYKQKNEEWWSKNEDYLKMVLNPDFKNLHEHKQDQTMHQNSEHATSSDQIEDSEPMVSNLVNSADNHEVKVNTSEV